MIVCYDFASLNSYLQKVGGKNIGFVPTMGCLHEGHLKLIESAKNINEIVVVSIFVNPIQFNQEEDYNKYPKIYEEDHNILIAQGLADVLYVPQTSDIYRGGFDSYISSKDVANGLCGATRGTHMTGVLTVLMILLNQVKPDNLFLGLKDYQQYLLVKNMVEDFYLDAQVVGVSTIRENSGLAKSSRNSRLSYDQKNIIAPIVYKVMCELREDIIHAVKKGDIFNVEERLKRDINKLKEQKIESFDYYELRRGKDLRLISDISSITQDARLFTGYFVGGIRLIDNIAIYEEE